MIRNSDRTSALPLPGGVHWTGRAEEAVAFTVREQLGKKELWREFADLFRYEPDDADLGWRCEFWGKTMRGACLVYRATGDDRLYGIIEESVRDMLSTERADGSFSTYSDERRFSGWDVWGRKYVLTGFLHFYEICRDPELAGSVVEAAVRHADALIAHVGPGKKNITETSNHWLGVNSCSVLEPVVNLYKVRPEKRFLEFARYILSTGGCSGGDLVALAIEGKKMPFEYPENKAYETMSFFEGALEYYTVTGEEKYLEAVRRFADAVDETDVTVIGCSGCTHELFDNSAKKQTEYSEGIMQETCVSVTWMRLNAKLHLLSGEEKYFSRIEKSALNALYGSFNTTGYRIFYERNGTLLDPLPFDSYSPLFRNSRFRKTGGLKFWGNGRHYGCCACIASAGVALPPLLSVLPGRDCITVNGYLPGEGEFPVGGGRVKVVCRTGYPSRSGATVEIIPSGTGKIRMYFRIPSFARGFEIKSGGKTVPFGAEGGYAAVTADEENGEVFRIDWETSLRFEDINGKRAFFFGPLTLAADQAKQEAGTDIADPLEPDIHEGSEFCEPAPGEQIRIKLASGLILTDYASCGHLPGKERSAVTAFFDIAKKTKE